MSTITKLPEDFHKSAFSCEMLFFEPNDSDFYQCLCEGLRFIQLHPEILEMIQQDQDQHGLKKKFIRVLDRVGEHEAYEKLEFVNVTPTPNVVELAPLMVGRPRMNPLTVFIYLLAESYLGGSTTNRNARNYLADSQTLNTFLLRHQIKTPGVSTIHDNLRCLSPATIEKIFDLQLEMIRKDELDTFEKMFIDSTAVNANSAWPTDSSIMHGLSKRIVKALTHLNKKFGHKFVDKKLNEWIELFDKLDFKISMVKGERNAAASRKKLYRELLKKVERFCNRVTKKMVHFCETHQTSELGFSEKARVTSMFDLLTRSINELLDVSSYCQKRIFNKENIPSQDKVLSLCDGDAAFIIKGGRDTVLGYKPQIAVSDNMFVTSVIVPEGNAADSDMLTLSVADSVERTGVIPKVLSTDDGYVSAKNLKELTDSGIATVSFGGSKGKKLLKEKWDEDEYIKARKDRSKAESIMFSLKHIFDFGKLQRRGLDGVRDELTMKAVIYNFYHMSKKKRASENLLQTA